MPGDFRCGRGDYARVLYSFAREAAGALGIRHSLRPLFSGRTLHATPRAPRAAGSRSHIELERAKGSNLLDVSPYIDNSRYMESDDAILAFAALAQPTRLDVFK